MTWARDRALVANVRGAKGDTGEVSTAAMTTAIAAAVSALKNGVDPAGDTLAELYALIQLRAAIAGPVTHTGDHLFATQSAGNNSQKAATTAFVKAAVDSAIAALVGGAPGALDTLNELAAALADDASYAATITAALAGKQPVDASLTALAALTTAANKFIYFTAADTPVAGDITAAGRALLDDADAGAQLTTLGAAARGANTDITSLSGTATNDDAAAGKIGEYFDTGSGASNASATVTMTIASPCVVTWTGHGFRVGAATTAVKFTNSGGALPTGITDGTTYYLKAINANTFNVATTAANALAGTFINTSGSQSGTHTGDIRVSMTTATLQDVAAISLAAGDWDVSGQMMKGAGASTTVTYLAGNITTASATLDRTFGRRVSFQYGGLVLSNNEITVFSFDPVRFSLASPTTIYLCAHDGFAVSTLTSAGWLRARRVR